jgi:hypothetical protein
MTDWQHPRLPDRYVPPPSRIQQGQLTQAELDRIKLPKKQPYFQLRHSKSKSRNIPDSAAEDDERREGSSPSRISEEPRPSEDSEDMPFIKVGGGLVYSDELVEDYEKDVYRWAILYENQRG